MKNFKVINESENFLFNRKEIEVSVESDVSPSINEVKKLISENFSTDKEAIKINKIKGVYGSKNFRIFADIYESKESREKMEQKPKKEKANAHAKVA